jgi:hypothetical protein
MVIWKIKSDLDLWKNYETILKGRNIQWMLVQAHNEFNEMVDLGARIEAKIIDCGLPHNQSYRLKKIKLGYRLVPILKSIKWSSLDGYRAIMMLMLMLILCLTIDKDTPHTLWNIDTHSQMTESEWVKRKVNSRSVVSVKCGKCGTITRKTCITNIQQGGGVGCTQCSMHKTEAKVYKWLQKTYPGIVIINEKRGPMSYNSCLSTRYDFHLTFPGRSIILELDGPQHFWFSAYCYNPDICTNDVNKERYAIDTLRVHLIRVLQNDEWTNTNDWDGWLVISINAALLEDTPRVHIPNAKEYIGEYSEYTKRHSM